MSPNVFRLQDFVRTVFARPVWRFSKGITFCSVFTVPIINFEALKNDIEEIVHDKATTDFSTPCGKTATFSEFEKLKFAIQEIGFFQIINHGIDPELIKSVSKCSREFFALPIEIKQKIQMKKGGNRGYFGCHEENNNSKNEVKSYVGDIKEGIDMGIELPFPDFHAYEPILGWHKDNQWLDEALVPKFRETMLSYTHQMMKLARQLASFMGRVIGYDLKFFEEFFLSPVINSRLLHYPPNLSLQNPLTENSREVYCSCASHTDYGCCTLLLQDASGGLEVLAPDGTYIPCPPIEGAFVVNLGDMMEKWSSGLLKSTVHRVVRTKESLAMHRYSIPFFFSPSPYVRLVPLIKPSAGINSTKNLEAMAEKVFTCEEWLSRKYNIAFSSLPSDTPSTENKNVINRG